MIQNDRLQPVQEFERACPEALEACLAEGLVKLPGNISDTSLRMMQRCTIPDGDYRTVHYYDEAEVFRAVPELDSLYSMLINSSGLFVKTGSVTIPAHSPKDPEVSHRDKIAPTGISALTIVHGPDAVFAASDEQFELGINTLMRKGAPLPKIVTHYGQGDILLIAQKVETLNGRIYEREQVHHAAISGSERQLLCVDFITRHVVTRPLEALRQTG